ncbi:cation:proton antiporter [Haladaptatus pallidirubidus]|uniref:Cation:proton antiporter n=1 Tax=Haladaptatus pallidirubidus TaxID=1008152 RepID=A0AAV3UKU0_9EURY|nr:cation:proton antiporter [Haladaptatus pallidirubidus]
MSSLQLFLIIGASLLLSLILSEVFERLGEPGFLGEIVAGILLGPSVLMLISNTNQNNPFILIATIGGLLLFFDAGYQQISLDQLLAAFRPVLIIGLSGVIIPFVVGYAIGTGYGFRLESSLYLGLILSVTSVSIVVRTLLSLDKLDTQYGRWILGASAVDDVIGLLGISILPLFFVGGGASATVTALGLAGLFFVALGIFYKFLLDPIANLLAKSEVDQADFIGILGLLFVFGYASDAVNLSYFIGALAIGLIVSTNKRLEGKALQSNIYGIAYGVFIPLYFVAIGARMNLADLTLNSFVVVFAVLGLFSNFIAGYVGNRLAGGPQEHSLIFGFALLPRSESGIAIVALGVSQGIVGNRIFVAYLVVFVISVLLTPSLLKRAVNRAEAKKETQSGNSGQSAQSGQSDG